MDAAQTIYNGKRMEHNVSGRGGNPQIMSGPGDNRNNGCMGLDCLSKSLFFGNLLFNGMARSSSAGAKTLHHFNGVSM